MKSFLDHLKEEVLPTVQVADGGLDISKPAVRAAINAAIAGVVSQPAVTPYVVFNRLSKLLAQYHIVLPKRFLEGDKGVEVFEVKQFGHKMGMTDSGEFVNEVPATHYLFLQYGILSPFGITYAKPVVGGMFKVMARLVDKEELDKLMDMAEITMAEEAEQMQTIAKANAPKEGMHTALGDCDCSQGDSPSTKKAVKVSMKKIDEDKDPCWKGYEMIGMKKKGGKPVPNCVPVKEEQLDELTGKGKLPALKAVYKGDKDYHTRSADYHAARADRAERRGEDSKAERHMDAGYGHEHKAERAEAKSKRASALMTRAKANADIKASKAASKSARAEYNEETQIDEVSKRAAISAYREKEAQERDTGKLHGLIKKKFGAATAKHAERAGAADTGNLVHRGKSHGVDRLASAKSSSEMRKSKDGKIHKQDVASKKSEIKFRKSMSKFDKPRGHLPEETQIDELKKSTLASYIKKAHVSGLEAASQGEIAYANKDKAGLRAANKTGEKREQGIERAAGKLAKEETIAEKAPPGAKYERMVKHIKKGYAEKDGLSKKEKSIAYATAWKAKNREKGE